MVRLGSARVQRLPTQGAPAGLARLGRRPGRLALSNPDGCSRELQPTSPMPMPLPTQVAMLRMMRLARLLKVFKRVVQLQIILKGLVRGLQSCVYVALLLLLIMYDHARMPTTIVMQCTMLCKVLLLQRWPACGPACPGTSTPSWA